MPRVPCPICGDPSAFPFWQEDAPPLTCPDDPAWPRRSLTGICEFQRRSAEHAAALRRRTPDAFDANGNMLPGQSARVWRDAMKRP